MLRLTYSTILLLHTWRCGGTGIRARLKIVWGNPCRFDSDQRHQPKYELFLNGFYCKQSLLVFVWYDYNMSLDLEADLYERNRHVLAEQAALNNAELCELICSTNGMVGTFSQDYWFSSHTVADYYPDFVTLREHIELQKIKKCLSAYSPKRVWTVKDSFSNLNLTKLDFKTLFDAQWITAPALTKESSGTNATWRVIDSADELISWEKAWSGTWTPKQAVLFQPILLQKADIKFFAAYKDEKIVAGFIVNKSDEVVGLSNMFTPDQDSSNYWIEAINLINQTYPNLTIVGYERDEELKTALSVGCMTIGELRVWIKEPSGSVLAS